MAKGDEECNYRFPGENDLLKREERGEREVGRDDRGEEIEDVVGTGGDEHFVNEESGEGKEAPLGR